MPLAKSKTAVGLGNALINDRFRRGKGGERKKGDATTHTNHTTGEQSVHKKNQEAACVKMRSVTQQNALDEFLATAKLAATDFTAEKTNKFKIVHSAQHNPYLLSANEERTVLGKQKANRARLTVPRRPKWDEATTPAELDQMERESFLVWRRSLAELQENQDLLMTPFERNLEVWRQLWRVIERSDLVVQIVDARNPLMFRSEDLEDYVKEMDSRNENLLLINKADMMTLAQRRAWASYLNNANIAYKFFSARLAKEATEAQDSGGEAEKKEIEEEGDLAGQSEQGEEEDPGPGWVEKANEADCKILTVAELETIFLQFAPKKKDRDSKPQVGIVGYPNVGKSSTINALAGAKKVSVSATPGKTKHFQTIHLGEKLILCDCPGLVFPNFATTKADLVCNGVLPIDQLREFSGPAALVAQRIPKPFLDAIYGLQIRTRPLEEGGTGVPSAEELLSAYARQRGFATQGHGAPDQPRAARYILKDYVSGKLRYVEPPPDSAVDGATFNRELSNVGQLPTKRRLALAAAIDDASTNAHVVSSKSQRLDRAFFKAAMSGAGHMNMPFNHKYTQQGSQAGLGGKQLSGRKMRALVALENGMDPNDVTKILGTGKHFKEKIRGKRRREREKEKQDEK